MDIIGFVRNARERLQEVVLQSGATAQTIAYSRAFKVAKVALTAGVANAFAFAWQNPESNAVLVTRVIVDITTAGGTATAVMDVGVVANATSTAADIFNDIDLNSAAISDNLLVAGTGQGGVHKLDENGGTTPYITGKILTEKAEALVGNVYIIYTEI